MKFRVARVLQAHWLTRYLLAVPVLITVELFSPNQTNWTQYALALMSCLFIFADLSPWRRFADSKNAKLSTESSGFLRRHWTRIFEQEPKKRFEQFIEAQADSQTMRRTSGGLAMTASSVKVEDDWLRDEKDGAERLEYLLEEYLSYEAFHSVSKARLPALLLNAGVIIVCTALLMHQVTLDLSTAFDRKIITAIVMSGGMMVFFTTLPSRKERRDALPN